MYASRSESMVRNSSFVHVPDGKLGLPLINLHLVCSWNRTEQHSSLAQACPLSSESRLRVLAWCRSHTRSEESSEVLLRVILRKLVRCDICSLLSSQCTGSLLHSAASCVLLVQKAPLADIDDHHVLHLSEKLLCKLNSIGMQHYKITRKQYTCI
jgi:hypothetical protein